MKLKINNIYKFSSKIYEASQKGGAYVIFPWNIKEEFRRGRVSVEVLFENVPYKGSIVNMGLKDENNDIVYIIGIKKSIREQLNKNIGETINVELIEVKQKN